MTKHDPTNADPMHLVYQFNYFPKYAPMPIPAIVHKTIELPLIYNTYIIILLIEQPPQAPNIDVTYIFAKSLVRNAAAKPTHADNKNSIIT